MDIGENITIILSGLNLNLTIIALSDIPWTAATGSPITLAVFVPIETLWKAKKIDGYNEILVRTSNADPMSVAERIKNFLKTRGFEVKINVIRYVEIEKVTDAVLTLFYILSIPILVITFVTVFLVNYVSITNEYREIGIKKSIGFTDRQLAISYILRNLIVTSLSLVIAIGIGFILSSYLSMEIVKKQLGALVFVYPVETIIKTVIVVVSIVLVASLLPILKITRVDVITVLSQSHVAPKVSSIKLKFLKKPTIKMSIRNLTRKKFRGVLLILIVSSTTTGIVSSIIISKNFVGTYRLTMNQGFKWDFIVGSMRLFNENITQQISKIENISVVEPQSCYWIPAKTLEFYLNGKRIIVDTSLGDIMTIGIKENQKLFEPIIVEGNLTLQKGGVIITKKLSEAKGIKLNDKIKLRGELFGRKFSINLTVGGIAQIPAATQWSLILNIEDAAEIAGWPKGLFNALAVQVKDKDHVMYSLRKISGILNQLGKPIDMVFVKNDLLEQTLKILDMTEVYTSTLSTLLMLMIYTSILGVLTIIIHERKREFILLETIGFTENGIVMILLIEGLFLSAITTMISAIMLPWIINLVSPVINNPIFPLWVNLNVRPFDMFLTFLIPVISYESTFALYSKISLRGELVDELRRFF